MAVTKWDDVERESQSRKASGQDAIKILRAALEAVVLAEDRGNGAIDGVWIPVQQVVREKREAAQVARQALLDTAGGFEP